MRLNSLLLTLFFLYQQNIGYSQTASEINIGQSYELKNGEGEIYEVNVYLPRSYAKNSDQNYPVVYLLDGGKAQDFKHIAGIADLASLNSYLFAETILVGIQTKNRLYELTSINTDPRYEREEGVLGGSTDFRKFIKSIVFPFVEKDFRVSDKRVLMGESLAGLFVVETLLNSPDLFSDYVSVSPSLWFDDRSLAKSAGKLLSQHKDDARRFYVAMADEGGTMQKGLGEVLKAVKNSDLKNLKLRYEDRSDTESHWSIFHSEALIALRWLLPVPAPEYLNEPDPWYLIEGANPPGWDSQKSARKASSDSTN